MDGPHVEGDDRGVLRIYTSERDGFRLLCLLDALFGVLRPISLPRTDDARLWSDDHDESRKSAAACDVVPFEALSQPNDDVSLRPRLTVSVTREGCVIGNGDVPRDESGEGVAPRDRVVPTSADRVVDRPKENGRASLSEYCPVVLIASSSVPSMKETKRRGRDRTAEVEELVPAVLELMEALTTLF